MKLVNTAIFILVGTIFPSALSLGQASEPSIRIRLFTNVSQVKIKGLGLSVQNIATGELLSSVDNPIKVGKENIKLMKGQWLLYSGNSEKELLKGSSAKGQRLALLGDFLQVDNKTYIPSGSQLIAKSNGLFDIVATLPLEEYLQTVLPSEMPVSWPFEALKAQAVASRSYTLSLLRERSHLHYDVESTVDDQVFNLANNIGVKSSIRQRVHQALLETRGQILTFAGKKVYRAFYHADSGGRTERAKYVWGRPVNGQPSTSVLSPFPLSPKGLWDYRVTEAQLSQKLAKEFKQPERGLKNVAVLSMSPSGRVREILVKFSNEEELKLSAQEFRRIVGYTRLNSTQFKLKKVGHSFLFEGRGFGHGVGMCQWGARHLAKRGLDYQEILGHYYPQADISSADQVFVVEKVAADLPTDFGG